MVKKALATKDETLFEVEKIVDRKEVNGEPLYKVKWRGYPASQCSWEPLEHLESVMDMVEDYDSQRKSKASPKPDKLPKRSSKAAEILSVFESNGELMWRVLLESGEAEEKPHAQLRAEAPNLVIDYLVSKLKFVEQR